MWCLGLTDSRSDNVQFEIPGLMSGDVAVFPGVPEPSKLLFSFSTSAIQHGAL